MGTSAATNASSFNRRMPAKWLMARSARRDPVASSCYATLRGRLEPSLEATSERPRATKGTVHISIQTGNVAMIRGLRPAWRVLPNRCHRWLIFGMVAIAPCIELLPRTAASLPLYARQTGQPCATCHTAFLELTPFGRRFKLGGYTLGGGDWNGPPFAVMLQPTFTNTAADQQEAPAPHFATNNNLAVQQVSLFTGGRITDNLGAFVQGTYDGVGRRFSWDNTDIRFAKSINLDGHTLLWGVTANNNPAVQDVWNTIPAWSFPYISSALAPMPTASTFIEQVYAQQVAGLSAYTFLDDMFYFE